MIKFIFPAAALLLVTASLTSCKTQKQNLNYFSADKRDSSHMRIWQSYEARIQPGDRLAIVVSALNQESASPYNLSGGLMSASTSQSGNGIKVEDDGRILYPQLGFIKAASLTTDELRDTLLKRLKIYLTDPVVTVNFLNLKVTVLGEVGKQGPILIGDRRINLLQALGEAGDINFTGSRDSILIIRETEGKREFAYVNLLSNEVFKSPYFVLQQNDVVVVPMNSRKVQTENDQRIMRNLSIVTSVLAVITTVGLLILNLTR